MGFSEQPRATRAKGRADTDVPYASDSRRDPRTPAFCGTNKGRKPAVFQARYDKSHRILWILDYDYGYKHEHDD